MVTYPPRTKKQTTENQDDPNRHVFYSDSSGGGIFKKKKGKISFNGGIVFNHGDGIQPSTPSHFSGLHKKPEEM